MSRSPPLFAWTEPPFHLPESSSSSRAYVVLVLQFLVHPIPYLLGVAGGGSFSRLLRCIAPAAGFSGPIH